MLTVKFLSHNRKAQNAPNPAYPDGIDVDLCDGSKISCAASLPYPAECCGVWLVQCSVCSASAAITAAGRIDDPRNVKLKCCSLI
jgi:hypothetical protein